MAEPFPEGSRVRVRLVAPHGYAVGAAEALDGQIGTVETVKGPTRLVVFDAPIKSWWSYGGPVTGFHFELSELEAYLHHEHR